MEEPVRKRLYFPHVEGLRGLTALYVFLFHVRGSVAGQPGFANFIHLTPFLGFGHYAVAIFIVISGFCLGAPIARDPTKPFSAKQFAVRRFRRIYPAYFAALIVSVAAFFYWGAAEAHHVPPLSHIAIAFGTHALLIHNFNQQTAVYFNVPLWSVGVEAQIYIVFALLLVPVWRRFGIVSQCGLALVLGILPHVLFHGSLDWTCPWFLGLFAMGVTAAYLAQHTKPTIAWRVAAGAIVTTVFLIAVSSKAADDALGYGQFLVLDLLVGVALSTFLIASAAAGGTLWLAARPLAYAPIAWLGTFAYSVYLLHYVAIVVLRETLRRLDATPTQSIFSYMLLIPAVLAVSYGFYLLFERPFMSKFLQRATAAESSEGNAAADAGERPQEMWDRIERRYNAAPWPAASCRRAKL